METTINRFGKETPLTITRGDVHDYLGMTINFSIKGKVKFYMFDYIEQILMEAGPSSGPSVTPAGSNLFRVNASAEKLSTREGDQFH